MTTWPEDKVRTAKAMDVLRAQVDALAPGRDISSDGTLAGSAHHVANPNSDHEAHVADGDWHIVTAIDISHDPKGGCDAHTLAEVVRAHKDPRIKYIISNKRIWNPAISDAWRVYNGSNPHDMHTHFSMKPIKALYDSTQAWDLGGWKDGVVVPTVRVHPVLRKGATGNEVRYLQRLLGFPIERQDGIFGPKTETAVESFQSSHNAVADGVVGPYTWRALEAVPAPPVDPHPALEGWNNAIAASVFGGDIDHFKERSAYDSHLINNAEMCVALPWSFTGKRPTLEIISATDSSKRATGVTVEDKGPWLLNDNYFMLGTRPLAELAHNNGTRLVSGPNKGRVPSNAAGIDLSPALAKKLGIDDMGKVNFRFEA